MNQLYYGDNLTVLRDKTHFPDACVDLIYLDPPFNSKRDYNLLFKSPKGQSSAAQIEAFEDTWHWNEQAEREFDEIVHSPNTGLAELVKALRSFLGENDMMAYLTMMANRLLQLHRVLKPTGSLYLHCDPTASHYLKIVLDGVFGKERFLADILWKRTTTHSDAKRWSPDADNILAYTKTNAFTFNAVFGEDDSAYREREFRYKEADGRAYSLSDIASPNPRKNLMYVWKGHKPPEKGWRYSQETMAKLDAEGRIFYRGEGKRPRVKRYLDEMKGTRVGTVWTDLPNVHPWSKERLGYPTQKPVVLLERIIAASSNEGDVVLDPFCGCGTAVHAAHKLKRKWLGIDITHLAISLIEKRLKDAFGKRCKYEVHGTPKDLDAARHLAQLSEHDGRYQFQYWAVSLVEAQPAQGKKKGADKGIDGIKNFRDLDKEYHKLIVSVKSGKLKADDVRALNHVRDRERAEIGVMISLEEPTKGMLADAASAGFYESPNGKKFPRVQLLTVAGLMDLTQHAKHPDYEPDLNFKKAKQENSGEQKQLL